MERRRPRKSGERSFAHQAEWKASQRPRRRNNSHLCGTRHGYHGTWLYCTVLAASALSATDLIRSTMRAFSRSVRIISGQCARRTGYSFMAEFRSLNSTLTAWCRNLYSTSTHLRTTSTLLHTMMRSAVRTYQVLTALPCPLEYPSEPVALTTDRLLTLLWGTHDVDSPIWVLLSGDILHPCSTYCPISHKSVIPPHFTRRFPCSSCSPPPDRASNPNVIITAYCTVV